jgi:hypothetical protein
VVALRRGGGTIRLEREEDGEYRAADKVELFLQRKALECVEDATATVLEVVGKKGAEGGQHEDASRAQVTADNVYAK